MKLLLCPKCSDVIKLKVQERRSCACGASHGMYIDDLNAEYGGDAIPLGFSNPSLMKALEERDRQIRDGVEANKSLGITFTAFTIPTGAESVTMLDDVQPIFKNRPKTDDELALELYSIIYSKTEGM